ncbi:MAG: class IV adenylate cyclase [Methanospirillaceae archaeon]|nr:class IV adenylate cyclase [Methanospirillaceae archaeon]
MMYEVEIKVRVPLIDTIRQAIRKEGGIFSEVLTETDHYYNAPHRDFSQTDEALRIRITENKTIITYKGPKETIQGTKIRKETNLEIRSFPDADSILTSLGFYPVAVVIKKREYWTLGDFSIALDEVAGLGSFVEVELISEDDTAEMAARIDLLSKKLGILGERITVSYLELLCSKP